MIFSVDEAPVSAAGRNFSDAEVERRIEVLTDDPELVARILAAYEAVREEEPMSPHVEEQLYTGFFTRDDQDLLESFHTLEWPEKFTVVEQFEDQRLKLLGLQLIHVEHPDALTPDRRLELDCANARRIANHDESIPWLTLPKAPIEIGELLRSAKLTERSFLLEHRSLLSQRLQNALTILLSNDVAGLSQPA